MALKRTFLLSAFSVLTLTGCGDGYEMIKTDTMFPYGNQRTAGSGVAYVLAKMLPKKELKLETVERDWKPKVVETLPDPAPVKVEPKLPPKPPKPAPIEPQKADKLFLEDAKK